MLCSLSLVRIGIFERLTQIEMLSGENRLIDQRERLCFLVNVLVVFLGVSYLETTFNTIHN